MLRISILLNEDGYRTLKCRKGNSSSRNFPNLLHLNCCNMLDSLVQLKIVSWCVRSCDLQLTIDSYVSYAFIVMEALARFEEH